MAESTFSKTMKTLAESPDKDDQELLRIVNEGSERTKYELEIGARDNEKFRQYLVLQETIATNAENYLSGSRTAYEKFKSLVRHPSQTGAKRLLNALTFGFYKPHVNPQHIGSTVLDLFKNQKEHQGAVQTSYDMLQNRRRIIYGVAKDAAQSIADHSKTWRAVDYELKRMEALKTTLDGMVRKEGELTPEELSQLKMHLSICSDAGLFDPKDLIERIGAGDNIKPDLYVVTQDVDYANAQLKDKHLDEGLEVKGGATLLEGLDLQKGQFDETVKAMGLQLKQLDVDLRYTQQLAQNTFYLSTAQGVSQSAMDAFDVYKKVMNDAQTFNTLGARVMLDRAGFLMNTPFFDPERLEKDKEELTQAAGLFLENQEKFNKGVEVLVEHLDIKPEHQFALPTHDGEGPKRDYTRKDLDRSG